MIYFDYAATAPTHPQALELFLELTTEAYGNPSSIHRIGQKASKYLSQAHQKVAQSLDVSTNEIIFTGSATEANNTVIYQAYQFPKGSHIITSAIEHPSILHLCQCLEQEGYQVTYLPVDQSGVVSLIDLQQAITSTTVLVSIMAVNNEVGTVQPIKAIGQWLNEHHPHILFHVDAVQALGKIPIDIRDWQVNFMTFSGHKFGGLRGVGILYVQQGTAFTPLLVGGEQQNKQRAGTENTAAIYATAYALQQAITEQATYFEHCQLLKDYLLTQLTQANITFEINGSQAFHTPNIVNLYLPNLTVDLALIQFDLAGIALSSGSACTAGNVEPSHVITAMYDTNRAAHSFRISFSLQVTTEDIDQLISTIKRLID